MTLSPQQIAALSPAAQRRIAELTMERRAVDERIAARSNLRKFTALMWDSIESVPFQDSWVVGALCEHMQAVAERQIRRLIINIYFRSGKSVIVSELFQPWVWLRSPGRRFLYLSHTQRRALHDAGKSLDIMRNPKYQQLNSGVFVLSSEAKGDFSNDKTGRRVSLGAESNVTGEGSSDRIFDDPNDVNEVESPVKRGATNDIFDNLSTRSDSFEDDTWTIVQQRTHPNDVTGHVKEKDLGFEYLSIPLEYDGRKTVTSIGWTDPRTEINEVADPVRFPPSAVAELRTLLGYRFAGQANQDPSSPEGNAIKRAWYPLIDIFDLNDVEALVLTYDCGFSSNLNADWTWGAFKARLRPGNALDLQELTLFQHFGKWDDPDRDKASTQFGLKCKALIDSGIFPNLRQWNVVIEAGVGPGVSLINNMRDTLLRAGLPASASGSNVNKVVRTGGYIAAVQNGKVGFYRGNQLPGFSGGTETWINPFFNVVCLLMYDNAPDGTPRWKGGHDDPLDAEAMAHDNVAAESVALTQPILFY